jgi:hypothetical protein
MSKKPAWFSASRSSLSSLLFSTEDAVGNELTLSDAIHDPMIGLINQADGISGRSFAQLLESAARLHRRRPWGAVELDMSPRMPETTAAYVGTISGWTSRAT